MSFIYQFFLFLGFTIYLPVLMFRRKAGPSINERFGKLPFKIKKSKPLLVWVHAVSLGETKAIGPLVHRIKEVYGDEVQLVISSGTATGRKEAEKAMPFADYFLYLPLDFSWIMKRILKEASPDLVLISETDLWYNFLTICKESGAKLLIVNGKMSEKTHSRYQMVPFWSRKIFSMFDKICVQSDHYTKRFVNLGVPKSKLEITGNLKLDHVYPASPDLEEWKASLNISDNDLILVVGSSHHPEERWFLEVLDGIWKDFPYLKVLLVPRHPERFKEVEELLEESGQPYTRYSKMNGKTFKIMLVDAMGILKKCYQIADVALVAGSYAEHVGGHNILEPCEYSVPVIFGPNMKTQPELEELCLSYGAGMQVPMDNLSQILRSLLNNKNKRKILGQNGLRLIRDNRGATNRTFEIVKQAAFQKKS